MSQYLFYFYYYYYCFILWHKQAIIVFYKISEGLVYISQLTVILYLQYFLLRKSSADLFIQNSLYISQALFIDLPQNKKNKAHSIIDFLI